VSKDELATASEAFRGFKGDVENLLSAFAGEARYEPGAAGYYHPGRSARALMNGIVVAEFGQVHRDVQGARKLKQAVFLAEFDLEQLYKIGLRPVRFTPLQKYPAVERDFSFVFDDAVTFAQMREKVEVTGISELCEFRPVEVFRGGSIGAGKHSVLLRARFQSSERTLREEEVAQWSAAIVSALTGLGGVQRV
jgi:phenylalanyl-tRNA synthetase beta chain